MIVSMPINVTSVKLNDDAAAIRLVKETGFEAFDMSCELTTQGHQLPYVYKFDAPDYKERAEALLKLSKELDFPCCAAHGPCITGHADPEILEHMIGQTVRAMEVAAIVGAPAIVVHPMHHMYHAKHAQELRQCNIDMYRKLMPYARDFGIKVAVENLIEPGSDHRLIPAVCGTAEEMCDFVDSVDPDWMTVCLDLGHSSCAGVNPADMIRALGKERIYLLHIHDNDLNNDHHNLPYMGKIDFDDVIKALRDIHFDGVLDYEVNLFRYPIELYRDASVLVAKTGQYMKKKILGCV